MSTPDQARGRCPVCDRDMLLKKDGTLRHHGGPVPNRMYYRTYSCQGVGQLPTGGDPLPDDALDVLRSTPGVIVHSCPECSAKGCVCGIPLPKEGDTNG